MDEIDRIFTDHETFASVNVQDPVFPLSAEAQDVLAVPDYNPIAVMSNRSEPDRPHPPLHTPGVQQPENQTLEPYIRRRSSELIDIMIEAGSPANSSRHSASRFPARPSSASSASPRPTTTN